MTTTITAPTVQFHGNATSAFWQGHYNQMVGDINKHILQQDFPHPDLANATSAGTNNPSTLAKRDANGGITHSYVVVTVPAALLTGNGFYSSQPAGFTGNHFVAAVGGQPPVFTVSANGTVTGYSATFSNGVNANVTGTAGNVTGTVALANGGTGATTAAAALTNLGAPSTTGTGATGTWPIGITGTAAAATALAAPTTVTTTVADYKPGTSASAGAISVGPGGAYVDSAGNVQGPFSATRTANLSNPTSSTQPTGTNIQYVAISQAPSTSALVATGGTVAALGSATSPIVPSGNAPVALVVWRGATTNPSNIVAAADIIDLRNFGAAGSGGGAGGGTTDTGVRNSAQLGIKGTSTTFPNAIDWTNAASLAQIHPANISAGAGQGTNDDLTRNFIQPDTLARIATSNASASAPAVVLNAAPAGTNPGPWTIRINGRQLTTTTALTATGVGSSGTTSPVRYLIADVSGSTIALSLSTTNNGLSQYQTVLEAIPYDSTAGLKFGARNDVTPLMNVPSLAVQLVPLTCTLNGGTQTNFTSPGTLARPANVSAAQDWFATSAVAFAYFNAYGNFHATGANPVVNFSIGMESNNTGAWVSQSTVASVSLVQGVQTVQGSTLLSIPQGEHQFTLLCSTDAATTYFDFYNVSLVVLPFKQ